MTWYLWATFARWKGLSWHRSSWTFQERATGCHGSWGVHTRASWNRGCVSSGGKPTPLAHRCSWCENFHTYIKCEVKTWWDMGMWQLWQWVGHLWLKWVGHLWWSIYDLNGWGNYGKVSWYAQKNTGLQGSIISGHHMTTGFSPFELPTRGLLQKGWDHSPPKLKLSNNEWH